MTHLLEVKELSACFYTASGVVRAVNSISYSLNQGETLAIVGESGCGKSASALCLLRLIPDPPGRIVGGKIIFDGQDLLKLTNEEMRKVRWSEIAMVFQDPLASFNPILTIGFQIQEALLLHEKMTHRQARNRARELLALVGIPNPERRLEQYPHQFSGGMRQRAMIAMALSCNPRLLIADEPTTALDVTLQAQIVDLISDLQQQLGMAVIWISHDLGVIARLAQRVAVMYAGSIVEEADVETLFASACHPYTKGLLQSIPQVHARRSRLVSIPGQPPDLTEVNPGCPFASRCEYVVNRCQKEDPSLESIGPGHQAACWQKHETRGNAGC